MIIKTAFIETNIVYLLIKEGFAVLIATKSKTGPVFFISPISCNSKRVSSCSPLYGVLHQV